MLVRRLRRLLEAPWTAMRRALAWVTIAADAQRVQRVAAANVEWRVIADGAPSGSLAQNPTEVAGC
jgi:hypothetical protein